MNDAPTRRIAILLLEDSDCDAQRLETLLKTAEPGGFDIARVRSLAEATSYLKTRTPDCALLDLKLTDAEGVEVIESLAALPTAVALILLTGHKDDELCVSDVVAGAIDYLPKSMADGPLLVRSIHHAVIKTRFASSLAEAQSIAKLGSWEMDLRSDSVRFSRELYRLYGIRLDELPTYAGLIDRTHADDRAAMLQAHRASVEGRRSFKFEHRIVLPHGIVRWMRARGRVELDRAGKPRRLIATEQDITDQKAAETALLHQAFHDPLSGLPNRLLLLDRLTQALNRLARQSRTIAVIHLDVDRFKVINDSLGHSAGDQILLAMAERLTSLVRLGDTLARVNGDEFIVLCEGLSGEDEVVTLTERICTAMTEPLAWDGGQIVVTVSAGIALAASAKVDPNALLRDADAAMHRAKADGRGRSAVFAQSMRTTVVGRLDTEMALRRSILDGDLRLHYQPIVNLVDGVVLGHEALVRWEHPARGLVWPDHFIAIAEETGLIVPLGAWVVREACQEAKRFQARHPRWSQLTMSVNLSGGQLGQRDLEELIGSSLHDADLAPEHLQLEMTESVLMDDAPKTITILQRLKDLGVRLGVDDFGTGFSSLAYLKRFPVDVIKIDRSFVSGLGVDPEDSAIVEAVVSLANTLGLVTIAEGVETSLQRDVLVRLGCSRSQGYLFARPMPPDDAAAALDLATATPIGGPNA